MYHLLEMKMRAGFTLVKFSKITDLNFIKIELIRITGKLLN